MDKKADIYAIPQTFDERNSLRKLIDTFMGSLSLTPPLSMSKLHDVSDRFIKENDLDRRLKGWIMVEVNNCVWSDIVASIPYERRVLLLPQCLNNHNKCEANIDELGLLCHRCMACSIPNFQDKAESLGIISIVSEGFTAVAGLVESGTVDAVIGVGCLDSLEKAFPLLINNAVPGIAIALNKSGCRDTDVDYRYVESRMSCNSKKEISLVNYERVKSCVSQWFSSEGLIEVLGPATEQTSTIAREWLAENGKRWRPYLLACTYLAVSGADDFPEKVRYAAVAVECFHKASLVHDDIQDCEEYRYDKQTVYSKYGTSIAINVGDVLLGEGYKALALCGDIELVKVVSAAHIALCHGQGMELQWEQSPKELTMEYVLEIFRNKTVPAFDVALDLGVLCYGDNGLFRNILHSYSQALGIAYQLQDDLDDFDAVSEQFIALRSRVHMLLRPSAVLAALCEENKKFGYIEKLSRESDIKSFFNNNEHNPLLQNALNKVRSMVDDYHNQAIAALDALDNIELKRLLFRVTDKILKAKN